MIWMWGVKSKPKGERIMARKRTTHRSKSGKKLYAVRDSKGALLTSQTTNVLTGWT